MQECSSSELRTISTLSIVIQKNCAKALASDIDKLRFSHCITTGNHWSNPTLAVILISHKNASKGGGLKYVQQKLSISPEETIAVGDGASDVPMMQYATIKVAMGNAEQTLKSITNHVVASLQDDGAVEVLERFIFSSDNQMG